MIYKFVPGVKYFLGEEKIVLTKGIWNFTLIELLKKDYIKNWNEIYELISSIIKEEDINEANLNPDLERILLELRGYQVLYKYENFKFFDLIICNENVFDLLNKLSDHLSLNLKVKNLKHFNISDVSKEDLVNYQNPLVIYENDSLVNLRALNESLVNLNKNFTFALLEGDFIHIFSHNSAAKTACFECYYERIVSRMNTENFNKFLIIQNKEFEKFKTTNNELKKQYTLLMLSMLDVILNNTNVYLEGFLTNNRLLKFFLPTFELNYDYLLKMPFCKICGSENKKLVKKSNIETLELLKMLYGDNHENK